MTPIVVGYGADKKGRSALELARLLAVTARSPLIVCSAVPSRWRPVSIARQADHDFVAQLRRGAEEALADAAKRLGELPVPIDYEVVTARSSPSALLQCAESHHAGLIVAGSADGPWGHIALGSVTDRLVHSSAWPVAIAPRGLRYHPSQVVPRVTVAFDGTDDGLAVVDRAGELARSLRAPLRLVTFGVRGPTMIPPEVGLDAEDLVLAQWRVEAEESLARAITLIGARSSTVESCVGIGNSWSEALDDPTWREGEILVVGSSSTGSLLARVFLGSTATRILRHSPVPVVVVP